MGLADQYTVERVRNVPAWLRTAPLHLRLFVGIVLVLAACLGQDIYTYYATADAAAARAWGRHTVVVLARVGMTRTALLEMIVDYRGFLLTGEEAFLNSYSAAARSYTTNLATLEQLTEDNPPQVARWQELEQRHAAWERKVSEPGIGPSGALIGAAAGGQDALASNVRLGQQYADDTLLLLNEATGVELALLNQRDKNTSAVNDRLVEELGWGSVVTLGIGLVIAILFARNLGQAMARVRAGERRYRQMFENNPSIKLLVDPTSGAIIEANRAACEFYGYSHGELLRRRVSDINTLSSEAIRAALAHRQQSLSFQATGTHRLASGELRDVDVLVSPVEDTKAASGTLLYAVINDLTDRNLAEAKLRIKTSLLEARGEASPDGILAVAPDGRVLSFNHHFADLCGLPAAALAAAVDRLTLRALMDQSAGSLPDPGEFLARAACLHDDREESNGEVVLRDGRAFDRRTATMQGTDGVLYGRVWFFQEITQRRQAEMAAQKTQEFLAAILESVGAGIVACDADGVLTLFNDATRTFHGLPEKAIPANEWAEHYDLYEVDGTTPLPTEHIPLFRALRGERVRNAEMMIIPKDGRARTVVVEGRPLFDGQGHTLGAVVAMHDISDRRQAEEQLRHQALHDELTDLPNRTLLQDRLAQALRVGQREDRPVALLLLDLDRFKEINDTFGHQFGDLLLRQIGPRLRGVLRASDSIARLGGDEFAVLLPGSDAGSAVPTAELLLRELESPFILDGVKVQIGASIGVASYPAHGNDAATLLRQADVAMYVAKHAQRGIVVYKEEHDRRSADQLTLGGDLRLAIENDELILQYQPKVDVTGRLVGVEALVRWRHPQRGLIGPDEFIGLAEHIGLIKPLTRWVLETALRQCRSWLKAGLEIRMAVNVSMHDLLDDTLPETVSRLLRTCGVPAEYLGMEITESSIMSDAGRAMSVLTRLRALGVSISVDDFGTGYSSLAYLKQLPAQEIKIDRSFVCNIATDEEDAAIVRSTIGLGHDLGLTVVAEGVEDQVCWNRLREFGCDLMQGYFVAAPLSASEMDRWVVDHGQLPVNWDTAA